MKLSMAVCICMMAACLVVKIGSDGGGGGGVVIFLSRKMSFFKTSRGMRFPTI